MPRHQFTPHDRLDDAADVLDELRARLDTLTVSERLQFAAASAALATAQVTVVSAVRAGWLRPRS